MSDKKLIGKKRVRSNSINSQLQGSQNLPENKENFLIMQKTIDSLNNRIKNMETKIIAKDTKIAKMKTMQTAKDTEIAKMKAKITVKNTKIAEMKTKMTAMKKKMKKKMTAKNTVITKMKTKMNKRQKKYTKIMKNLKQSKQIARMNKTNKTILEEYENAQMKINQKNNSNNSKIWNNLNKKKICASTEGNKILNILDDIDDQTVDIKGSKKIKKRVNKKDYKFPFGKDIKTEELFQDLKKLVSFINENYPRNVRHALKDFFNCPQIRTNIAYISENNGIISTLKKDILINLLLESDKTVLPTNVASLLCNTISDIPLEEIKITENNEVYKLNKQFLIEAVNSKIINDIYIKVCKEYVQNFDLHNINIKKRLNNIIQNMNIYFGELPEDICGLTLNTGDVIINGRYLNSIYNNNAALSKKLSLCAIFLVLLHELSHILTRKVKEKCDKKAASNSFIESEDLDTIDTKSFKFINLQTLDNIFPLSKNKILNEYEKINEKYKQSTGSSQNTQNKKLKSKLNESGQYFDYHFYHSQTYTQITKDEADFFLNLNNYNLSETDYYDALKSLYSKRNKNVKGYLFKRNNLVFALPIVRCGFH